MSASGDADTIRRAYEAFGRGDMDAIRAEAFTADIRWHQGGRSQVSGDYAGIDAVLGYFVKLFELSNGTFRTEVHDVLASDNHVVVLAAFSGQRGQKSVGNGNYCQVFHMRDGRADECWVTPVDAYGVDEFWA